MERSRNSRTLGGHRKYVAIAGVAILGGWIVTLSATTWLADLPCMLNPNSCSKAQGLSQIILFSPLVIGSVLTSVGVAGMRGGSQAYKVLSVLAFAALLFFSSYLFVIYLGIGFHGLRG